ncbi:hypothetical protein TanjilG_16721 [Lupinus angustifolius]|uniref:Uncharacterized protein n=1 Tax=Lupinus angustifolius TaxID=3871 RepID=A0A4P1R0C3_LUPAN|nr:PREDICTED: uncharacterized protein LOC109327107 [Lupinus angustifolius]OIV98394.1 hypothetical protein TanjilG_16721 [Lupinus angustifolius]
MARLISKKFLFQNATVSHSFFSLRHRSSSSSSSSSSEYDVTLKLFDDLIQRILVKKATPDWLPFVPGSSFWVPPRPTPSNVVDLVHKFTNDFSQQESLSLATIQGCPSSKFFIQECESARGGDTGVDLNIPDGMEDTVEVKVLKTPGNVAHSEDEEG